MITAGQQPLPMTVPVAGHSDHLAQFSAAARVLGWSGVVLPDLRLFGDVVTVVVAVDHAVHEERRSAGWAPVTDRSEIAMWSWPENASRAPAPAVGVVGVITTATRWQRSVKVAARFGAFGSTALITDTVRRPGQRCQLTAQLHGVGVVWRSPTGDMQLASPGRIGPVPTARPTVVSRWLQEVLYDHVLRTDSVAPQPVH